MSPFWNCPNCGPAPLDDCILYQAGALYNPQLLKVGPWCQNCGSRLSFDADHDASEPASGRVLLLSGACASGKTTLAYLLARDHGVVQVDGDWLLQLRKAETGHKHTFDEIHPHLLALAAGLAASGHHAVIAHVILPEAIERYDRYFAQHGIRYGLAVLKPNQDCLLDRNLERKSWPHTTPEFWVKKFDIDLENGPPSFQACFYDSSHETPEDTAEYLWKKYFLETT